jgi:arylsulfatase A
MYMKINLFILLIGIVACNKNQIKISERPNVVIIFTDDQGYQDVGCFGAKGFTTPNLDNMAVEGMRFSNFYVASAVCSPSRAALLTGSYPVRVGVPSVLHPVSPTGLDPSEITIAEILKEQGYATACVGKWHLGDHSSMMPTNQGFDEYFGLPYSNDMWPWRNDFRKETPPSNLFPDLPLYLNTEVIEKNPDQNKITKRYTEFATKFIEKNKDNPFFLYFPHSMPHIPLGVSEKFEGKTEYGRYGDVIEEIDWSVGEILKTLEVNKLDTKTLVIFTSDNGPWLTYGNHAGKAFPLREGKGTTFEGGMRVPCIMRWPGNIPANSVNNEIATTMDLLPTIARLAGSSEPEDRVIDGENIWELMSGRYEKKNSEKKLFYHQATALQAMRKGPWKLHFPHQYRQIGSTPGKDGNADGQMEASIGLSLYNLEDDIGESNNLAAKYPDIVKRLTDLADIHLNDLAKNSRAPLNIEDLSWRRYKDKLEEGEYITDWWLIGSFDNKNRKGIDKVYPPEKEYDSNKSYSGKNNKMVSWMEYNDKNNEYISLSKLFKPSDEGVVYARRVFNIEKNKTLKIGLGSNDGVKMWVNGKLVHENIVARTAVPNEDIISVPFIKGKNVVLLKIDQLGGGWGFYFSLMK